MIEDRELTHRPRVMDDKPRSTMKEDGDEITITPAKIEEKVEERYRPRVVDDEPMATDIKPTGIQPSAEEPDHTQSFISDEDPPVAVEDVAELPSPEPMTPESLDAYLETEEGQQELEEFHQLMFELLEDDFDIRDVDKGTMEKISEAADMVLVPLESWKMAVPFALAEYAGGLMDLTRRSIESLGFETPGALDTAGDFVDYMTRSRREINQHKIIDSFREGRDLRGFLLQAATVIGDVRGNLKVLIGAGGLVRRMLGGKAGFSMIATDSKWLALAKHQSGRAALGYAMTYARTKGTYKERHDNALLTAMFMMTPAFSGMVGKGRGVTLKDGISPFLKAHSGAISADLLANMLISANVNPQSDKYFDFIHKNPETGEWEGGGLYRQALDDAKAMAESIGMPELESKFAWMNIMPILGSDIGFSLLTRSFRANHNMEIASMQMERPSRMTPGMKADYAEAERGAISQGLEPALAKKMHVIALKRIANGELSAENINNTFQGKDDYLEANWDEALFMEKLGGTDKMPVDPETFRAQRMEQASAEGFREDLPELPRRMEAEPEGRRPSDIQTILDSAPSREDAIAALTILSKSEAARPHLRALYDAKNADAYKPEPEVGPTVEAARGLQTEPRLTDLQSRIDQAPTMEAKQQVLDEWKADPANAEAVREIEGGDYRGAHRAPTGEFSEGSLAAMDKTYPDDVYAPDAARVYGDRADPKLDAKAARLIRSLRNKPDAEVTVYRAVPKGAQAEIAPGDWVTPIREYAESHGERFEGGQSVIQKKVRAGELFTEGNSLFEYGWQPREPRPSPLTLTPEGRLAGMEPQRTPIEQAQAAVSSVPPKADGSVDMEARQRVLDEWRRANPEAVREIEGQSKPVVTTPQGKPQVFYRYEGGEKPRYDTGEGDGIYLSDTPQSYFRGEGSQLRRYVVAASRIAKPSDVAGLRNERGDLLNEMRKDDVSFLDQAEIDALKAKGFDAAEGPLGMSGREIVVFERAQLLPEGASARPSPLTLTPEGRLAGMEGEVRATEARVAEDASIARMQQAQAAFDKSPKVIAAEQKWKEYSETGHRETAAPPREPKPADMVERIASDWEPRLPDWSPERIASIENILPTMAGRLVPQGYEQARPSEAAFARNVAHINTLIPKVRTLAEGGAKSQANSLIKGVNLGLAALRGDQDLSPFNMESRIQGMVKGKQSVKGFGPASAEVLLASWRGSTPEDALRILNDFRMLRDAPAIFDKSQFIGELEQRPRGLSEEDRTLAFNLMDQKLPANIRNKVLDSIEGTLPRDPDALSAWTVAANQFGRQALKREMNRGRHETRQAHDSWMDHARKIASSRYFFMATAGDAGDVGIFRASNDIARQTSRAGSQVNDRFKAITRGTTGTTKGRDVHRISSTPEVELAISRVLGIDPATKNKRMQKQLHESVAVLDKLGQENPKFHKVVMDQIESIRRELQGNLAARIRYGQLDRFQQRWEAAMPKRKNQTVAEAYAEARATNNAKLGSEIEEHMANVLPLRGGEKPEPVPVTEMMNLVSFKNVNGKEATLEALRSETFGTRKYYWMSEREINPAGWGKMEEGFTIESVDAMPQARTLREIHTREGDAPLRQGSLYANLHRHMMNVENYYMTLESQRELINRTTKAKNSGHISDKTYNSVTKWIDNQMGKSPPPDPVSAAVIKANSLFWTTYPLAASRILWYSARNVLYQGAPWGVMLTQFKAGDVGSAYGDVLRSYANPQTSMLARWMDNELRTDVSQKRGYFNEIMLMRDPASRHQAATGGKAGQVKAGALIGGTIGLGTGGPAGAAAGVAVGAGVGRVWQNVKPALEKYSEFAISAPDEFNRVTIGSASFVIGERYLNRYLAGQATYKDVESGLMLNALPPAQKMDMAQLFSQGQAGGDRESFYPFLARVAEVKNENANHVYRVSGKSMVEQHHAARQALGLINYPRGQVELFTRNGFFPMMRNMETLLTGRGQFDGQEFYQGLRIMGIQTFALTLSGMIADHIIGRKADDDIYSPLGWFIEPGSVGASMSYDLVLTGRDAYRWVMGDQSVAEESLESTAWKYFFMLVPAMSDVSNVVEASYNIEGRRRVDALYEFFSDERARWNEVPRSSYEKAVHSLFGTVTTEAEQKDIVDSFMENNVFAIIIDAALERREKAARDR